MGIKTFIVVIKEKMNDHPIKTSYTGDCTEKDVINFYGLRENNVEWFSIKEVSDDTERV